MHINSDKSFNDIYTAYYRKSFLYVKSYVHNEMAAEDIVSESLIKLWEIMKRKSIDPIAPYLFTLLKNRALDFLKHQSIEKQVKSELIKSLSRELEIRIMTLEMSDPKDIFSNEVNHIINITLNNLPLRTKEIFLLSRFENKPNKEIADLYNISIKGVDYHISQAIRKLRPALKDYLPIIYAYFIVN